MLGFRRRQLLVFLTVVAIAGPLLACSVPVFRFALERWPSDPYIAVVFHRGKLTAEQQKVVKALTKDGLAGLSYANVAVETVDLDDPKMSPELKALWEPHAKQEAALPRIVLRYPHQTRVPLDAWSAPLDMESVKQIIDSPKRAELAQRIVKGDSAVFLFLESGDKKQDDERFAILEKEVAHQQQVLKLPEIDPADVAQGFVTIPPDQLKIQFSVMRLSQQDPREQVFVNMLLGTEEDLHELRDEPMVFPIFGRGRALYAIIGKGINKEIIGAAGVDLTGPCTCTVKDQNPGTDLLMALDWESVVKPIDDGKEPVVPTLTGFQGFSPETKGGGDTPAEATEDLAADGGEIADAAAAEDEAASDEAAQATPAPAGQSRSSSAAGGTPFAMTRILLFVIGAVVVVGGAGLLVVSRSRN